MGRIKKKGTSGQAKNYITRTQAVRKLQLSLPDFRRLCIFKGVYPREPRTTKKAFKSATSTTTFYYTKDIQYLLHEPLLQKFRDHKAVSKKIARYLGRGELGDAARLDKSGVGKIRLDHIIKERYPTFVDAIRDLDDALSMLFLFANLPSNSNVSPKTIATCQRLCNEFQHYIIVSHSLRKSFLSIKGIYYQASIQGQDVLWLVPYKFVQQTGGDIDFRIMSTFVEFYVALLGFVNYRLYTNIGLRYPPKFDIKSDELGGELGALKLEGRGINETAQQKQVESANGTESAAPVDPELQKKVDDLALSMRQEDTTEDAAVAENTTKDENEIDTFEAAVDGADTLLQPQISNADAGSLFEPMTVYLSRETPRQPLEFLLRSFGCRRIGWDAVLGDGAFTNNELDPNITHQIVDRPVQTRSAPDQATMDSGDAEAPRSSTQVRVPGRVYIQPQWVWDCINSGSLLKTELYGPGEVLPPHLSPWVKVKRGEYDPTKPLEEQEKDGEAAEFAEQQAITNGAAASDQEEADEEVEGLEGMDVDEDEDEEDEEDEAEDDDFAGFGEGEEGGEEEAGAEDDEQDLYQKELAAEAAGTPFDASAGANGNGRQPLRGILKTDNNGEARKKAQRRRQQEEEELERRKGMMTRKQRKLYERMEHGNKKTEDEAATLRAKRRKIESEQAKQR